MREIKFRVWWPDTDGTTGKMYENVEVCYKRLNDFFGGMKDSWVFMQFTGLQDKNGTDIYEGDIVKAVSPSHIGDADLVSDVIFESDCQFQVRSRDLDKIYNHGLPLTYFVSLEVVGNVCNNPKKIIM